MYRATALQSLRKRLSSSDFDAIIIPTNDPHFGEYTQEHYKIREWLSGFTGSAGVLAVTISSAALWTDSRYFVQADAQLNGSKIELMKLKMPGTPSVEQWLKECMKKAGIEQARIAIDEALFSYSEYCALKKALEPSCTVEPVKDFFNELWPCRKPLEFGAVEYLPIEYSGEETRSKCNRLKEALGIGAKKFAYIVTACDEVAWLCNIRGTDIEYNPLPQSYVVVMANDSVQNSANGLSIHLFIGKSAVSKKVADILNEQGVVLHDYFEYVPFLESLSDDIVRICSASKVSVRDYMALSGIASGKNCTIIDDPVTGGALNRLKAVKNPVEQEGFRKAYLYDGVAWCRLLKYIDDSLSCGVQLTEYAIGEKLISFRKELCGYRGESFEPIVAVGENGALPHYSATADSSSVCRGGTFLLMDTGAQFPFGTTDTTRTIPIGELDEEKKKFYTLVLKGMIALSRAKFPSGTRGASLDILARGPLYNEGVMYFHGTGHGIGHFLCVHEGPQSVRMEENPVPLEPGMVISNEPAIYFEGRYGIRTENVVMVKPWKETEFNSFNEFETLTLVPIVTSCILPQLLTKEEIQWLDDYNATVCAKITPLLNDAGEKEWLRCITCKLQ